MTRLYDIAAYATKIEVHLEREREMEIDSDRDRPAKDRQTDI